MISRLRTRHRRSWIVLAVGLPVLLALAWLARPRPQWIEQLPAELRDPPSP